MHGFSPGVAQSKRHVTGFLLQIENIDLEHVLLPCLNLFLRFLCCFGSIADTARVSGTCRVVRGRSHKFFLTGYVGLGVFFFQFTELL